MIYATKPIEEGIIVIYQEPEPDNSEHKVQIDNNNPDASYEEQQQGLSADEFWN